NKTQDVVAQLYYEGKPISKKESYNYSAMRGEWKRGGTFFAVADAKGTYNTNFNKDNLKDGSYNIKMTIDGEEREYPFKMIGGKPVCIDEQDKTKNPDLSKVFEGMNKEFWVK